MIGEKNRNTNVKKCNPVKVQCAVFSPRLVSDQFFIFIILGGGEKLSPKIQHYYQDKSSCDFSYPFLLFLLFHLLVFVSSGTSCNFPKSLKTCNRLSNGYPISCKTILVILLSLPRGRRRKAFRAGKGITSWWYFPWHSACISGLWEEMAVDSCIQ